MIKIFVSGNQTELRDDRFIVKETITSDLILKDIFEIFLFEDLPATGKNPISAYITEVKNSDI
jgi:hypothetical protein